VIAIAGLGVALWLGLAGKTVAAAIIGALDIVGLVAVFVLGRRSLAVDSATPGASPSEG
jgi:hypothetical protein